MDELPEGGDLLPFVTRVLGLVDRQAHAVAEAGALGDAHVGASGGCRAHLEPILWAPACAGRLRPWRPDAMGLAEAPSLGWRQQGGDGAHDAVCAGCELLPVNPP